MWHFIFFRHLRGLFGPAGSSDSADYFKMADPNGDGKISLEELLDYAEKHGLSNADDLVRRAFHLFDLDNDGFLTLEEYRRAAVPEVQFKLLDRDGDGKVTFEELNALLIHFPGLNPESIRLSFELFDENKDGSISLEEFRKNVDALSESMVQ
ncbi:EF hand domain-containing protein [Ditylenchus destructor]|uniref:EF hand domain-containing protein n=1 Tax=Ditylenchus destructor TaxID=166010 RepID=A0AAD4MET2_9BILA|nr:EF hand domain-containing protein [Ditylenchus destructor]